MVKRFEAALRKKKSEFFDLEAFEVIIEHYLSAGKNQKALKAVEFATEQYPFSSELVTLKAQIFSNMQRFPEAEELLRDQLKLNPSDIDSILNLGSVFSMQKKYDQAIELYQSALEYSEDQSDEVQFNLGLVYQAQENYALAIVHFKEAVALNLSHEGALYELAYCLDQVGQLEGSLSYYQKFIDEDPYSTAAWYNLGIIYNKLERFNEAIQAYEYAVAIDDQFASAFFNMGNACMSVGTPERALDCFKQTLDLEGPSPELYCSFGMVYEHLGQFDLGLKYFQKATKLDPTYDEAWFGAGMCLERKEQWPQALHFFNKAVKIDFNNPEYWKAVARMDFKVGNVVSAIGAFEEASQLDPTDREIWTEWAYIYQDQGEFGRAASILSDGLAEMPEDAVLMYRIAANLMLEGRMTESFGFLEQALLIDYDAHEVMLEYFPKVEMQRTLMRLISQFRDSGNTL